MLRDLSLPLLHLTTDALEAAVVADRVATAQAAGRTGAIATFIGTVRGEHLGRRVVALEYEAYEPLTLKVLARIADEAAREWPSADVAIHHRIGRLLPGEASIVIAAASPHRADAFAACRYAIERVKQIVPIWKREIFDDGQDWPAGSTADPDDETARATALRRACGDAPGARDGVS
jgi:molybdopterin synthase catalytic subunit